MADLIRSFRRDDNLIRPVLIFCALSLAVLTAHAATYIAHADLPAYVTTSLMHGFVYCLAVIWVLRNPGSKSTLWIVLIVAALLRVIAMTAPPYLSTDAFRYVWDGRIGLEGWNPFLYVPADDALAYLRDKAIYPHINQKETAVTIYPPMAQMVFMLGAAIQDNLSGMKAVMVMCELLTVVALLGWLKEAELPRSRILIYAWHPLPIWEFASQAHIDAAATAFLTLGIWAAVCRRQGLVGALFACAALVKYFPLVLLPALWRRWDWKLPLAFCVTALLLYVPYVLSGGFSVFGFLSTHIGAQGYTAGWGFHPVWLLRDFKIADPPAWAYITFAFLTLIALALWAVFVRQRHEVRPEHLVLLGAAFVFLTSPHYAWYFGFLCALAVRLPNPALVLMTITCVTLYLPRSGGAFSWTDLYIPTYILPLVVWLCWLVAVRLNARVARWNDVINGR